MGVELVLFYGPPCSGKTFFYLKHFQVTHHRVCPSAIFDSEPDVTLRCLILKIVAILKEGNNVVLDDENESKHTRASYVNLIKTKVSECKLLCIDFLVSPRHGHLQCNWAREWNIAQVLLDEKTVPKFNPLEKERKLCQWFEDEKIDAPNESEGFDVFRVQTGLCCESPFKLEVPALIMQVDMLFPDKADDEQSNTECLATVINMWSSVNSTGRVIFSGNIQHSCSQETGVGEDECSSCLDVVKERLRQLALKVEIPLYSALVDYSFLQYPFILAPQPGLIAWVQRLHTIDITNKASLYICTTEAHFKMAQRAGLKTFKAKTVLNNSKIVTTINCKKRQSAVPTCVSEPTVCYYGNSILPNELELNSRSPAPATQPSPRIPLLNKARDCSKEMEMPCIATEIVMGRCHGVCFKDLEMLEKYQDAYQRSASPTDAVLCTPFKPDCAKTIVPSGTANEQKIAVTVPISTTDKKDANINTSLKTALQQSKSDDKAAQCQNENMQGSTSHSIKIDQEDIERLALSQSRYKKGKEIQHLVKDLIVVSDNAEELTRINCSCTGSQGQNYDVFAVIGNEGIKQAKCSCLDSAGQTGQCKHVVAMLLKCIDRDGQTLKENSISNASSQPGKSKNGPHSRRSNRKHKSSTRTAGRQNTLYVMGSQELLEAANQILQEHHKSRGNQTEDDKNSSVDSSQETSKEGKAPDNANDTPTTKHSHLEDKVVKPLERASSRSHFTKNSEQMVEEEREQQDMKCSLHGATKRQRRSYGISILDEMI